MNDDCKDCPYILELKKDNERVESEMKGIKDRLFKLDRGVTQTTERYNSLVSLYGNLQSDMKEIMQELKELSIKLSQNDILTQQNKSVVEQFTVSKILALGVTILVVISYWKQ